MTTLAAVVATSNFPQGIGGNCSANHRYYAMTEAGGSHMEWSFRPLKLIAVSGAAR